jgi:hypothetical protein
MKKNAVIFRQPERAPPGSEKAAGFPAARDDDHWKLVFSGFPVYPEISLLIKECFA